MPYTLMSREEKIAAARAMNLFSNLFMSVALEDRAACEHVLRILTGIGTLTVIDQKTQYRVSNVIARDVVFDVLAQDDSGKLYNIEIQRADTINHPRRVALYAAEMIAEFMRKGAPVDDTPEVYIFYLSETDLLHTGQCVARVEKTLAGKLYDDGVHIAFANAEVDDESDIAKLMQYFKKADPDDPSQGALSQRVYRMKREKEGEEIMCQISDRIFSEGEKYGMMKGRKEGRLEGRVEGRKEGRLEGRKEGRVEGRLEGKIESIIDLTEAMHITDEQAMDVFKIDKSERPLYARYVKEMRASRATPNA